MAQAAQQQVEPRVVFNLYDDKLDLAEIQPGIQGNFWHGQSISIAILRLQAGAVPCEQLHQHADEHAVYCLGGEVEVTAANGEQWQYGEGDALILPGNSCYQLRALSDDLLLMFYFTSRQSQWGPEGGQLPAELFQGNPNADASAQTTDDAQPRLYRPRTNNTEQITAKEQLAAIPGTLELSHIFGQNLSLGYFSMDKGSPYPAPHSHGEEIGMQLRGHCVLHSLGNDYVMAEGAIIIIPPGVEHSGTMAFDGRFGDDDCIMISIQTPPRYAWGPEQD